MGEDMKNNKDIMEAKDVAEYLHVHLFTVHKYAREGKIPAFKIGADWRFNRKSIERWIREKEHGARSVSSKKKEPNGDLFVKSN